MMESRFLLLVLLAIPPGRGLDSTACDMCLDGVCYGSDMLLDSSKFRLRHDAVAIDRMNGTVYFVDKDGTLKVLNLTDKSIEATPINLIRQHQGITVDQNSHDMFIMEYSHMYKYQPASNETFKFQLGHSFQEIWFKDKLYGKEQCKIYSIEGDQVKEYTALRNVTRCRCFSPQIIDRLGDIYFTGCLIDDAYSFSTYKLSAGTETPVEILTSPTILLATDRVDNVYFMDQMHQTIFILRLDYDTNRYVEVGLFELPPHVTLIMDALFDKDNNIIFHYWILYHHQYELHHFKANSKRCRITKVFDKHSQTQKSAIQEL